MEEFSEVRQLIISTKLGLPASVFGPSALCWAGERVMNEQTFMSSKESSEGICFSFKNSPNFQALFFLSKGKLLSDGQDRRMGMAKC